jgi:tetratricopeptide (TPR) repeat protein
MNLRCNLILGAFLMGNDLPAQTMQQWLRWGDAATAAGDHASACHFYEGALDAAPGRMALQWTLANAYRLNGQCSEAAVLFERVHSKDRGRTYPSALRWLGEMQLCSDQLDAAAETWQRVRAGAKDGVVKERASNALAGIALARNLVARTDSLLLQKAPTTINTASSEFAPRIGPDGALYFTSLRGVADEQGAVLDSSRYRTRLYRSELSSGQWSEANVFGPEPSDADVANGVWSLDGTLLFHSHCTHPDSCRIHVAELRNGQWITRPLDGLGDHGSTQPCVVEWEGREMLLFASDRPGGMGAMDIWQARLEQGRAVELQPMAGEINTPGNERCPWYDPLRQELWFSSDHLPGLGGYDLFVSRFADDVFGPPVNPGTPLNSPWNDLYAFVDHRTGEGWMSSDRPAAGGSGGNGCCSDILHWSPPPSMAADSLAEAEALPTRAIEALLDLRSRMPLRLYFHNDEPGPRSTASTTTLTYSQTLASYTARLPDYAEHSSDTSAFNAFWSNSVLAGSQDLTGLVHAIFPVLEQGRSVVLEVRGHASPLALNDYNGRLSERRITSLRNELSTVLQGALRPYLEASATNGARLELNTIPFGEEDADSTVSDRINDRSRSIYSVGAARERRIEVIDIEVAARIERADSVLRLVKELGDIRQDQPQRITFRIQNPGSRPLRMVESDADCGCTTAELPKGTIAPGSHMDLPVDFSGRAPQGPLSRHIRIRTDGVPGMVELIITGTVIP